MTTNVFKTVQDVMKGMADYFIDVAQRSIAAHGVFNVVLSGGHSPELLHKTLASIGYKERVPWEKVNFFFGDERYVPSNDPDNNAFMAKRTLLDPLNIAASNVFPIDTALSPTDSAEKYSITIATHFEPEPAVFDLIILGLGDNAHTASLFPFTPILTETSASVQAVFLKDQNVYRISMTAPLINQARHIAFLAFGHGKAEALQHVLEDEYNPELYPAQLIHTEHGDIQWFLDEDAAALLKK